MEFHGPFESNLGNFYCICVSYFDAMFKYYHGDQRALWAERMLFMCVVQCYEDAAEIVA